MNDINTIDNKEIINLTKKSTVVVFGKGEKNKPYCGFTANMQNIFDDAFPEYEMINILGNRDLREAMKTFSDWPTFPQVYINGKFIGGGDIIQEMYEEKELEELIK